jgi:two-component system, LytTR family, sensor histidine kinase AlgZ
MSHMKRSQVYLLCQVLGWSTHAVANIAFSAMSGSPVLPTVAIFAWGACCAMLCSHGFRAWIQRANWLKLSPLRALPRVFFASIVVGCAITLLVTAGWPMVFGLSALMKSGWLWVFPAIFIWSVTVFLWAVIYFGVHYFENYQIADVEKLRLAVVAKDAQLRVLLAQVNPHFIFNCLNSLRALILEDPPRAQTMVTELANMLRYSLQSGKTESVSLETELDAVSAYLKLEGIRLEERLRIKIEMDPHSLELPVPPMLLQTLVENGVKHGVARLPQGGEILLASRMENGALKIQVRNSGQLTESAGSTRVGLENIRQRLRLLYGDAASVVLRNQDADFVVAEVSIPLVNSAA